MMFFASDTRRASFDRALRLFAWFVLAFMVLVILEGAVVRATGSGAGCGNHWPLCNGEILPHHPRLATIIEFAHRSMTGVLVTLAALLITGTFQLRPAGHRTRRSALWVAALLFTEALLGAVLVKGGYVESNASSMRVVVQCIHFSNTMLLVAALTVTAYWLRPATASVAPEAGSRTLALWAIGLTMVVGATGSVAALADTLFPSPALQTALAQDFAANAPLLVRMRWVHPFTSCVALACVAFACRRTGGIVARWVLALLALQFVLGIGDVLLLAPTWMQVLHLFGADMFWIALVILGASQWHEERRIDFQAKLNRKG